MDYVIEFLKQTDKLAISIAGIALILSFISTITAIIAVSLQRIHNRMSVRPIPDIILGDYDDCIEVTLLNAGLGPMTLIEFQVIDRETRIINNNIVEFMPNLPDVIDWSDFATNLEGRTLAPGETKKLLLLEQRDDALRSFFTFRDEVRLNLSKLSIIVTFTGVYNEKNASFSRDLSWFGRHFT